MTREVAMFRVARRGGRKLLAIGAVAALALAGCSGNTATHTPVATPTPTAAATPTPTPTSAVTGCDLKGASAAIGSLDSYKFKMTLAGGASDVALANLPLDQADSYDLTGTIMNKPDSRADITIESVMPGAVAPSKFHVIEVGGFDYFDADGNGTFTQVGPENNPVPGDSGAPVDTSEPTDSGAGPSPSAGPGLAAQFAPAAIYETTVASAAGNGFGVVGTETKDGVQAVHCSADAIALERYASTLGVTDATWTADIWLASSGGFPVSVSIVAKAKDNSLPYEVLLDLSNVNDQANNVVAPTNIGGA